MMQLNQPVFVTGVERSGSTLVARILTLSGIFTGKVTTMLENAELKELCSKFIAFNSTGGLFPHTQDLKIPVSWKSTVDKILQEEGYETGKWMFKCSLLTQMWPIWNYAYPNAKWLIVRRRTGDVIESCVKTAYMVTFKAQENLDTVGVIDEREGWKWWVHQYENKFREMIETGVNCKIIWPERMVVGDYQQIYEMLDWLGMQWNSKIVETIDPMLVKSRRKEQWHM
jgi:hypothetical protein